MGALQRLAEALTVVLTEVQPGQQRARYAAGLGCLGQQGGVLPALSLLRLAAQELPTCRLPTQDLVELLKDPLCVGLARRIVLDQLEQRYHRPFADHWEFVRFVRAQQLGLDLTSPPRRAGPGRS